MSAFTVTVRTDVAAITYRAIGTDSASVVMAAQDKFGPCRVTVKPA